VTFNYKKKFSLLYLIRVPGTSGRFKF